MQRIGGNQLEKRNSITETKEYIVQAYQAIPSPCRCKVGVLKSVHLVYMTVLLQWEYIAIEMWDKVSFYSEQLDPKMEGD